MILGSGRSGQHRANRGWGRIESLVEASARVHPQTSPSIFLSLSLRRWDPNGPLQGSSECRVSRQSARHHQVLGHRGSGWAASRLGGTPRRWLRGASTGAPDTPAPRTARRDACLTRLQGGRGDAPTGRLSHVADLCSGGCNFPQAQRWAWRVRRRMEMPPFWREKVKL